MKIRRGEPGLEIPAGQGKRDRETDRDRQRTRKRGRMSEPLIATKWMSYLAEGLLAEEEVVQPSNPFFWCNGQQPVEQVDCR